MLSFRSFPARERKVWIGVAFSEDQHHPIRAIAFSFDPESLASELETKVKALSRRTEVSLKIRRSRNMRTSREGEDHVKLVADVMFGRVSNIEAFDKLDLRGLTRFEKRVYRHLTERVKRGSVITYGELAKELKTSPRAIGGAMRRNPYPIVVPCHRVVSSKGLGGYTPSPRHKAFLLLLEGVSIRDRGWRYVV